MPIENTQLLSAAFTDVDRMVSEVRDWDLSFQPLAANTNAPEIAHLVQRRCDGVPYCYARFRLALDQQGAAPRAVYTFTVPSARVAHLWWQGRDVLGGNVLVYRPGEDWRSLSAEDFEVHIVSLTQEQIGRIAAREGMVLPGLTRLPRVFRLSELRMQAARATMRKLRDGVTTDADAFDALLRALVCGWLVHAGVMPRDVPGALSERALGRAIGLIEAEGAASLRVSDLCARAGVSRRTLEAGFQDRFGMGPGAFVKRRRLASARRMLREDGVLVGEAMAAHGFSHVGQFAADYARIFGELPSRTLRCVGAQS